MTDRTIARGVVVALVLAASCWGLGTVVSKAALAELPPLTLFPIQLASSLAVLVILMRNRRVPIRGSGRALLGRLGLLNPGIAYALSLVGLTMISASLSVVLWALEPLMILVLAAWFLHERVTPTLVAMTLLAVTGMIVLAVDPTSEADHLVGVALTVAGVACCAVYTVLVRRWIPDAPETSQVVLQQQAYALALAVGLVAIVGLVGGAMVPERLTPVGLASAIGSGALYYAGAYWFYLGALRHVPASRATIAFYLVPVAGLAAGAFLLGERLDVRQWFGVALILVSVLAIVRRPGGETGPARVQAAPEH